MPTVVLGGLLSQGARRIAKAPTIGARRGSGFRGRTVCSEIARFYLAQRHVWLQRLGVQTQAWWVRIYNGTLGPAPANP